MGCHYSSDMQQVDVKDMYSDMGVFCNRLRLGSTGALDCRTGQILQKIAPIPTRPIEQT